MGRQRQHPRRRVARDDAAGLAAALRFWLTAKRPEPVPLPGADSAARYLALFDELVAQAAALGRVSRT